MPLISINVEKVARLIGLSLLLFLLGLRFRSIDVLYLHPWRRPIQSRLWHNIGIVGLEREMSPEERAIAVQPLVGDGLIIKELTPPGAVILLPFSSNIPPSILGAVAYPRRFYYSGDLEAYLSSFVGDGTLSFLGSARENAASLYGQSASFGELYLFLNRDQMLVFGSLDLDDIVVRTDPVGERGVLVTLPELSTQRVESIVAAIDQTEVVLLEDFQDEQSLNHWTPCHLNNVKDSSLRIKNSQLLIGYHNDLSRRDIFSHHFIPPQSISMLGVKLRVIIRAGTRLSIDTVVNGERVSPRFIGDYPGTASGDWEEIVIPVNGKLDALAVGISESSEEDGTDYYYLQIDWIKAIMVDTDVEDSD